MKEFENSNKIISGNSIVKNTVFNLLGFGVPLIFAVVLIPILVKGLGTEKFGILSLTWVVIGYFSFFDFGIGRAVTQIIAEKIGINQIEEIPEIFWTSFFMMLIVSSCLSTILLFLAPLIVNKSLNISLVLRSDTLSAFYIMIITIPIVTTTAGIRGFLEAYQKFGIINIIRIILGISSFLIPVLCMIFTNSLFWIVIFLLIIRFVVWLLYLNQCFQINPRLKNKVIFKLSLIKPILKLSGWMAISNIIAPVIVYLDRFLIATLVSAVAISYYSTPYEIISKLLLIPSAITGVLFPAVSASYLRDHVFVRKISFISIKYIFIVLYPIVFIISVFAYEGINFWLGKEFAENSSLTLQFMAVGVLFNSIAFIPVTFFQGIGRADITAKIHLFEFPFYFFAMWVSIKNYGINGAAFIWFIRMFVDAVVFIWMLKKQLPFNLKLNYSYLGINLIILISILSAFINIILVKIFVALIILVVFSFFSWNYILALEDRKFIISKLKMINKVY